MSPKGIRKSISIKDKYDIIAKIENGASQANVAREKKLSKTTVSSIWKKRDLLKQVSNQTSIKMKKLRKPVKENVDIALYEWFKKQRMLNTPISGPLLKEKAEHFAKLFNDDQFKCSSGWLDRFKRRYDINSSKMYGEASSVNTTTTSYWLENVWPNIRKGYNDADIFNGDETGLFYKCTPERTLKFRGEKCVGGKQSKERVTVFLCANMTGTEKRKLLVIGKFMNPRCMKHIKKLPVKYTANPKSWMTSTIFENELRNWDTELRQQQRKVLLLVDNCPAHPIIEDLKNIKLCFLPPNCSSVLQPMDQGIIHCLKSYYRRHTLLHIIHSQEKNEPVLINLLDGINMLAKSWQQVSQDIIKNCFAHSGLVKKNYVFDTDDELPLKEWISVTSHANNTEIEDWQKPLSLWLENHIATSDIVNQVLQAQGVSVAIEDNDSESDMEVERPAPSYSDAVKGIKTVIDFLESDIQINDEILNMSLAVEKELLLVRTKKLKKQTTLDNYLI